MSGRALRPLPSHEEYERLLARLNDAEELLRAIREGEVDALLMTNAQGSRVYTVNSADEPYRILVEQMQEGAVTLTADGTVLYCNPRFTEMVRTPASRIIGKEMLPFIAGGDRVEFSALLRECAAGLGRRELALQAADGTTLPALVNGNAMRLAGEGAVCLLITDLTEQRQMTEVLRQSQKIEAVGQLTAGVAHDFNNLLTAALGNLEIAEKRERDPNVNRLIQSAIRAAQRGARLTEQLLAFSRKQHLEPKPMDVNEIVTGMGDLLRSTMGGIIGVETRLQGELWPAFLDPNQIELVILNLAINARDAMPVGGTLTIETRNVTLHERERLGHLPAGEYVMIRVRDTGTGMSAEIQAKAFEPFFTTKEAGKGSGLGLSMVHGVVTQLGGGVRIESSVGEGTAIVLYLPRARPAAEAQADSLPVPAATVVPENATVLVVDDDSDVREITEELLSELGYGVVSASSGPVALELLGSGARVDLMLIDFAMPGMNGVELAERVRLVRPDIPVLFATGYAHTSAAVQLKDRVIVRKPYRHGELAQKLRAALGHQDDARANPPGRRAAGL
jgi:PAS domain S-box-containing protein